MTGTNGNSNGQSHAASPNGVGAPPTVIADLAASCVRYVQHGIGFTLDFQPETLPVLDHYVVLARKAAHERQEAAPLIAQAIGAYLGEVARRKYGGFWRIEDDPRSYRVEFEPVYLVLRPIELITRALELPIEPPGPDVTTKHYDADDDDDVDDDEVVKTDEEGLSGNEKEADAQFEQEPEDDLRLALFEVDDDDNQSIADRLASWPPVPAAQYHSPSTHFEVIELIVETIRARRISAGMEADAQLEPDDYAS